MQEPDEVAIERAEVSAYLALCQLHDWGESDEVLDAARRHLRSHLQPEEGTDPVDGDPRPDSSARPWVEFAAQPRDVQDRRVLEAVGAHRMTSMQITDAMKAESPDCFVGSGLRKQLDCLVAAGELAREPWKEGPCRYRWFRRVSDMAELEQAFEAAG